MRRRSFLLGAAALLALAGTAEARVHAPYRGHRIVPAATTVVLPPLDTFTAPTGAYAFRKMLTAYAGSAIRIRRASDSLEADIGFVGNDFDNAAAVAHCAATTCFGRWWYDQSGAARNIGQLTAANQPQLIFNCKGSLPCWSFGTALTQLVSASNFTPATGILTLGVVANRSVGTNGFCALLSTAGAANRMLTNNAAGWQIGAALAASAPDAAWHSGIGVYLGASSGSMQIDGNAPVTGTAASGVTPGTISIAGVAANTCLSAEAVFWDNYAMPAPERTAWIANQRAFWGF